ncbi:anaphase-promoting complex subunit 1 isoform X4 [Lampetra fluviatilis]
MSREPDPSEDEETMISAWDAQEFEPCGRRLYRIHPSGASDIGGGGSANLSPAGRHALRTPVPDAWPADGTGALAGCLREVTIQEHPRELWEMRAGRSEPGAASDEHNFDEELYASGRVAVWSRGSSSSYATVHKSFTVEEPIQKVLWCDFQEWENNEKNGGSPAAKVLHCVCIAQTTCVDIHTSDGQDFSAPLPFQVANTWPTKQGLLFEREAVPCEMLIGSIREQLAMMYSMLHPLDTVSPVLCRTSGVGGTPRVGYTYEHSHRIVFASPKSPLLLTFDPTLGLHAVWFLRKATPQERSSMLGIPGPSSVVGSLCGTLGGSVVGGFTDELMGSGGAGGVGSAISFAAHLRGLTRNESTLGHGGGFSSPLHQLHCQQLLHASTTAGGGSGVGGGGSGGAVGGGGGGGGGSGAGSTLGATLPPASGLPFYSWSWSPTMSNMASLSRSHSPAPGSSLAAFTQRFLSPSPRGQANSSANQSLNSSAGKSVTEHMLNLPDLCMDHLWTEKVLTNRISNSQASKAFITTDLCGRRFLCYLMDGHHELRCVKFEESNDNPSSFVFGVVTDIPARDAAPLESLNMMLVLDDTRSLVLFTGLIKVSKVYVTGLQAPSLCHSLLQPMPRPSTPLDSNSTPSRPYGTSAVTMHEAMLVSPVPEMRESMGMRPESDLDDSLFHTSRPSCITGLRDPVLSRLTLELVGGTMRRVSLPEIASCSLVRMCLGAACYALPRDTALQLQLRWYTARNRMGSPGLASEWALFRNCLLTASGYDMENLPWAQLAEQEPCLSPVLTPKKPRTSDAGTDEDWEFLLNSSYHQSLLSHPLVGMLGLDMAESANPDGGVEERGEAERGPFSRVHVLNPEAPLFTHLPTVFWALHLVYEDSKLDSALAETGRALGTLLYQIASDLRLTSYCDHYLRDNPTLLKSFGQNAVLMPQAQLKTMAQYHAVARDPPCVCRWLCRMIGWRTGGAPPPFPSVPGVCERTRLVVLSFAIYILGDESAAFLEPSKYLDKIPAGHGWSQTEQETSRICTEQLSSLPSPAEKLVFFLANMGFTLHDLASLPFGVALPLHEAVCRCRPAPPERWPLAAYALVGRQDLSLQARAASEHEKSQAQTSGFSSQGDERWSNGNGASGRGLGTAGGADAAGGGLGAASATTAAAMTMTKEEEEDDDGMGDLDGGVMSLVWPGDLRAQEVRRLLQSTRPVRINVVQRPEVSDHDFIEEKEARLLQLCQRTMALPVGRGMFTLFTHHPLPTEPLPITKFNLTGRAPPHNMIVDLSSGNIDMPANMASWPSFHNGVACGLRIAPAQRLRLHAAWLSYNNRPQAGEPIPEYAGVLLALGLSGHLNDLPIMHVHDYLTKGHEMTTIGLLLGVSAAQLGTMDMAVTRLLAVHLPALLPPSTTEMDVAHGVQVAAAMAVGLVYQGTAHRHITETLLNEIGRAPGPEMENCTDRESYSLTAGLGLGMVCLGHGSNLIGMSDLNVPDQLYQYMVGGHRRSTSGASRERHKSPSYQIKEGDSVNVDVTCPGATLALAMIYLKTNNRSIADWLEAPETQYLLDFVKPDFLMLRILAKGLIMWDEVLPTEAWINSNVPAIVRQYGLDFDVENGAAQVLEHDVNLQTMWQAHVNIIAGACMAMGLRFAGSANDSACTCLYKCARRFLGMTSDPVVELVGRHTLESCLSVTLLALALVMAGTGNLQALQLCRFMHYRTGGELNYGAHMASHMALGFLFLGAGRCSLSTSNSAIAALLCALYPRFPAHSTDNRYHLQALRHLYVLAVEPRLLVPVDVDTGMPCYAKIRATYQATMWYDEISVDLMAPTLLPELHLLKEVKVKGPRHWEISIDTSNSAQELRSMLQRDGRLYVKKRAGHLSFAEDPMGYRSLLAQTFTHQSPELQRVRPEAIQAFSSDPAILAFAEHFCKAVESSEEGRAACDMLSSVLYECVTQEKPELLPTYMAAYQATRMLQSRSIPDTTALWQLRLLLEFSGRHGVAGSPGVTAAAVAGEGCPGTDGKARPLIVPEFLDAMKGVVDQALDTWLQTQAGAAAVKSYLLGKTVARSQFGMLAAFLVMHDLPTSASFGPTVMEGEELRVKFCVKQKIYAFRMEPYNYFIYFFQVRIAELCSSFSEATWPQMIAEGSGLSC